LKNIFTKKQLKVIRIVLICVAAVLAVTAFSVVAINLYVCGSVDELMTDADGVAADQPYDCILVLGAGIVRGRPSDMLADRLLMAAELYRAGAAPKIIVSGDHGSEDYDEVIVMKSFLIEQGVPSEDVFMDHAGFSTYESVYRAIEIFGAKRFIIVTQKYHLYRALYSAVKLGADVRGVNSDPREYVGDLVRQCREVAARVKDYFMCMFKPEPTFLGDSISLDGDGNVTNDNRQQIRSEETT
jgi:vancomycin permeability regulator SanA